MTVETLSDAQRKKRLGQYFTDQRVGRLLAALADAKDAKSIIDPMVGSANLLQACLSVGAHPERMIGIELDPIALDRARSELDGVASAELLLGDAFSVPIPSIPFDLVITNPPYIRYQSRRDLDGIKVPTSDDARAGLVRAITTRPELSDEARALWLRAARQYPGTSDMAVPAWILSASLVREGGTLAVVVPQVWLTRNYAQSVRILLDTAFDVEVILEDGDASWFDDAQVRTQLVVARRRSLTERPALRRTVMARATRDVFTDGEARGTLGTEQAVAEALRSVTSGSPVVVTRGLTAHVESGLSVASGDQGALSVPRFVPAMGSATGDIPLRTIESYGWRAGQGLRSGANDFFYVSVVDGAVRPAARWGIKSLAIPGECLLPAVRRQSELSEGFVVDDSRLRSRVVALCGWVTASDLMKMGAGEARPLPVQVGKWIDQVASTPFSQREPSKLFPDLAAVATNARVDRSGRPVKFWYQLPALTPRHRPTLFVARVCGGRPKTILNGSGVVVDANFSGLWPVGEDALPSEALLALLNSSWTWANLEAMCTVLGGGALKVEATDLRNLALPDLSAADVEQLSLLGRSLLDEPSDAVADAIDQVVGAAMTERAFVAGGVTALRDIAERALQHRLRG